MYVNKRLLFLGQPDQESSFKIKGFSKMIINSKTGLWHEAYEDYKYERACVEEKLINGNSTF